MSLEDKQEPQKNPPPVTPRKKSFQNSSEKFPHEPQPSLTMMASSGASAFWKTVRPHVPLIRFKKGGSMVQELVRGAAPAAAQLPGDAPPSPSSPAGGNSNIVLEEWQIPPRFMRADLTQEEIDCINSGGAM